MDVSALGLKPSNVAKSFLSLHAFSFARKLTRPPQKVGLQALSRDHTATRIFSHCRNKHQGSTSPLLTLNRMPRNRTTSLPASPAEDVARIGDDLQLALPSPPTMRGTSRTGVWHVAGLARTDQCWRAPPRTWCEIPIESRMTLARGPGSRPSDSGLR